MPEKTSEKPAKKPAPVKKLVKNTSDQAYALPSGQLLPAKGEVVVNDWESQAENETVAGWLDEGHLEISDAPEEPKPEPTPQEQKPQETQQPPYSSSTSSTKTPRG